MQKVFIIYRRFYDEHGEDITVGGIQTYIKQLIDVIKSQNLKPVVFQFAEKDFQNIYNDIEVYGVKVKNIYKNKKNSKIILNQIKKNHKEDDIIIFAHELLYVPTFTKKVIAVQHGITWDIPRKRLKLFANNLFRKFIGSYIRISDVKELEHMVCVDYNYVNWLRTQTNSINKNLYVIPNSTEIPNGNIVKDENTIKIIFARRFFDYRGTRLFSQAIEKILDKYQNLEITFAGEGPDEKYLKSKFKDYINVKFIKYNSEDSLNVHKQIHIAVIPTLGSEGTSLSLLEAMATKCAVIATNVGGMTNIIIDHYNGLMINPEVEELYIALESLILDKHLRKRLSNNAYETVSQGFSRELWEDRWKKVIKKL